MTHEDYRVSLAALVAGRLEGEERQRLQEHLEVCPECREIVDTWTDLTSGMRDGGETIFEAHPGEMELRAFARGSAGDMQARIQRHLESCSSCELEMQAWRRHADGMKAPRMARRPIHHAPWFAAAAAAAGVALGVALTLFLAGPGRVPDGAPAVGEGVHHLILPPLLRHAGPAGAPTVYRLRRGQQSLEVDFRLLEMADTKREDRFRFEIRRDSGETLWSAEKNVVDLQGMMTPDALVGFSFPTSVLGPGRYEFRVIPPDAGAPAVASGSSAVLVDILPPR